MKKYQDNSINESLAEMTLLQNLFNFITDKYVDSSVTEIEQHFLKSAGALVEKDEISRKSVESFLAEMGIEIELPKPATRYNQPRANQNYGDGGCGYTRTRSSC